MMQYRSTSESIDCVYIFVALTSKPVRQDSGLGYMEEGIHTETHDYAFFSIPCAVGRGGTLHYPTALQPAFLHGSSSSARASGTTKRNLDRTCHSLPGKRTYRRAIAPRRRSLRSFWSDDEVILGLSPQVAPTSYIENHTAGNEPHPATRYRHRLYSKVFGLFFEQLLNFRVGMSDHWARLSQTKAKLTEHPLALACSQCNSEIPSNVGRQ
jgi:hypothetical protein